MANILYADNMQSLATVSHGFFTRAWGNCGISDKWDPKILAHNRAQVALRIGVPPENLLSCSQIHSPNVVTVAEKWSSSERPQADAIVTDQKCIALGVLTADCGPLLFADEKAGVIGAAHAGWRGAVSGVIENTLKAMEVLGAKRSSIHVALGPCIGWNSYEVGPEFPAPFLAENPEHEKLFRLSPREGHYMFNLPGYIENKVRGLGVASFAPSRADTCADEENFFSYRHNTLRGISPTESLISVICLRD
jgi:YfiH family protein